jgi:hypothetical protein
VYSSRRTHAAVYLYTAVRTTTDTCLSTIRGSVKKEVAAALNSTAKTAAAITVFTNKSRNYEESAIPRMHGSKGNFSHDLAIANNS